LGYLVALAVVALVIFLAWQVSQGRPTPSWWGHYVVPAIYWSSPFLVALAIVRRIQRGRRRQMEDKSGEVDRSAGKQRNLPPD